MATMLDLVDSPNLIRSNGKSFKNLFSNPKDNNWEDLAFSEYCMDDSDFFNISGNLGGRDIHAKPGGVQNRMIRKKEWKLNFFNGYDSQLFNLKNDPFELEDLSKKNNYKKIKDELTDLILKNWNPKKIHKKMLLLKKEQLLQQKWAKITDPPDQLRWELDPTKDSSKLFN